MCYPYTNRSVLEQIAKESYTEANKLYKVVGNLRTIFRKEVRTFRV
jgi:hypothetical protein